MEEVISALNEMSIKYDIVNHPAAFTTEEADKYIEGMDGVPSKTLFMAGKKDRKIYMLIMDDAKKVDIKEFNEIVADKLHFGKEELLKEKLGLIPGTVSLFGLLNNVERDVKVYIDEEVLSENKITFHPNVNTATMFISTKDMLKFLDNLGYEYKVVNL